MARYPPGAPVAASAVHSAAAVLRRADSSHPVADVRDAQRPHRNVAVTVVSASDGYGKSAFAERA